MTKKYIYLFIAVLSLLLTSCLDTECIDETRTYMRVTFYSYETKKAATPDSLSLYGAGNDEKIFDNNKKVALPALISLKDSDNETEFIITINGIDDTMRFVHSNSLYLISKECGYSMYHTIDTVYFTTNEIDSIYLTNKDITLRKIENVAIFY